MIGLTQPDAEKGAEELRLSDTWRAVRIVLGKCHLRSEIASIVERVGIQDDQGDAPLEDIVFDELGNACQHEIKSAAGPVPKGEFPTSTFVQGSFDRALNSFISSRSADMVEVGVCAGTQD
jgi:hypothetical protein